MQQPLEQMINVKDITRITDNCCSLLADLGSVSHGASNPIVWTRTSDHYGRPGAELGLNTASKTNRGQLDNSVNQRL